MSHMNTDAIPRNPSYCTMQTLNVVWKWSREPASLGRSYKGSCWRRCYWGLANALPVQCLLNGDFSDPGYSAICIEGIVVEAKAAPEHLAVDLGNAQIWAVGRSDIEESDVKRCPL